MGTKVAPIIVSVQLTKLKTDSEGNKKLTWTIFHNGEYWIAEKHG